jgi:uncharacterized protein (TIGR03083 family)
VQDHLSHVVSTLNVLAGRPEPDSDLPEDPPWVRNRLGRYWEMRVNVRRGEPPKVVVDEFDELVAELAPVLRDLDDDALAGEVEGPMGYRMPLGRMLEIFAFDWWIHEQDIRTTVGVAGHLTGPAPDHAVDQILAGLSESLAAPELGLTEGATIAVTIVGPERRSLGIGIAGGEGHILADQPATPTVRLTSDLATFVGLTSGRATRDDVAVEAEGDPPLVDAVFGALVVTP